MKSRFSENKNTHREFLWVGDDECTYPGRCADMMKRDARGESACDKIGRDGEDMISNEDC